MIRFLIVIRTCIIGFLLLFETGCQSDVHKSSPAPLNPATEARVNNALSNPCYDFDQINTLVRDRLISGPIARARISILLPKLREYFYKSGGVDEQTNAWVFPVEGYGPKSIGGVNGNGYIDEGYDYFDGNRHGGHPAHDIFIHDKNQDKLDDCTNRPVNVLSVSNGLVVACESHWPDGSDLRGGKYVYIYEPAENALVYYAHNDRLLTEIGKVVKAGDAIAIIGRTGKSAHQSRSPTHLHFMFLAIEDGYPKPVNAYKRLLSSLIRPSECN